NKKAPNPKGGEPGPPGPTIAKRPERDVEFSTVSSLPIDRLAAPGDMEAWDPDGKPGFPGGAPYKRGSRAVESPAVARLPIDRLAAPEDMEAWDPDEKLGFPGEFPYTRGIHPTGYRGKLWTMRPFSGFGSPGDSN